MIFRVQVSELVNEQISQRYGAERSSEGGPSQSDFTSGPLAAALIQFSRFDLLGESIGPSVRHCHVLAPGFGAIVFVGVVVAEGVVEIADFAEDDGYWDAIGDDPMS